MATQIKTWEILKEGLKPIETTLSENGRREKEDLEKWIKTNPQILADNIVIIGEQVQTKSGPLDYLGIDSSGNTVIIELKRDKLAREVITQAMDYASDVALWDEKRLSEICLKHTEQTLEDIIASNFELEDTTINNSQRILLVGFGVDEALGRMIEWLSSKYDLAINAIILSYIKTSGGNELLSRTVIIPEEVEQEKSNKKKFTIPMSDKPGNYEPVKLKELLKEYLTNESLHSARRIKNVMLPLLLKSDVVTREEIKNELVAKAEANDYKQSGPIMSLISGQLGHEWKDFLRQVIRYETPKYWWEKDNFRMEPQYKELVKEILKETDHF